MSFFPEGTAALPSDSEGRSLSKWAQDLYAAVGNRGSLPYPEGSRPQPGDDEERLARKITAMLS